MLHSVNWYLFTDVSEQPIGSIFKYKKQFFLDCLSFEDGTDRLSQNIGYYPLTYAA
jgi:hypothetical protein